MNRIDRLFAILLQLQAARRLRAQDLAEQFEISKRTVYRDMVALSQMGVPVVSLPGEGFELVKGYYMPPLMFTEEEAVALFLASRLLLEQASGSLAKNAAQALAKIGVALPVRVRDRAEMLTQIIRFIAPNARFNLDDPKLVSLQTAIQKKLVIHLRYHGYNKDEVTEREVEPYQLMYSEGIWYVEGYCRLRKDIRGFRLSRIEKLALTNKTFYERTLFQKYQQQTLEIQIRFANDKVRWVRERQHYGFQAEEPTPDGVIMTYQVHDASEIMPWILGWGTAAEVLTPIELRQNLREIAMSLVEMLT